MSTVNAQNFGDGTDSVPASAVIEGTAKAAAVINADYNVSSGTDNGTGDYSYSLTNNFSSATFGRVSDVEVLAARTSSTNLSRVNSSTIAALTANNSFIAADYAHNISAFGDLA